MNQQRTEVDFEPVGRRATAGPDDTILSVAQEVGVDLVSLCGGIGACDSCKVRVVTGHVEPPTLVEESIFTQDELAAGWRLACQARPLADIKVEIPPESLSTPQRLQLDGELAQIARDTPPVFPLDVTVAPPTLQDLRADFVRLADAVVAAGYMRPSIGRLLMAEASTSLRQQAWSVRLALREDEIVAILPEGTPLLGLAVDIGTTSIAAYLVDLNSAEIVGRQGVMNPQIAYGEDVISRIRYINDHEEGQHVLQERLVKEINGLVRSLTEQTNCSSRQIVDVVVVGNTAMHHIFAGLPVRQLGEAPYVPAVADALVFPAREVGLETAPAAYVYMPPNIAGYVGADHVSMQAAAGLWNTDRVTLALDIGTNTEVTLAIEGRSYCCSCASGPAFEGAHIGAGMRAAPGAIERVQWLDDQVMIKTIGNQPPVGVCGSGILDCVAVMIESGIVNERGALETDHPFVSEGHDGRPTFVLVSSEATANHLPISINRKDVAEIQLAKAAIRAGIEILLRVADISAGQIDRFIVAGAFGTYIDVRNAIGVGMFPELALDRFRQVGNAAGMGAVLLLLSQESRRQAAEAARKIDYIELTTYAGFQDEFIRHMTF